MRNARLDESQAGIRKVGRNNNFRYANVIILKEESEEVLMSLLMKVKEKNEKAGLKLNIQQTKITASSPIISWKIAWASHLSRFNDTPAGLLWWAHEARVELGGQ